MGLVSTLENPVPEGAITGTLKTQDGVLLRHARWAAERRSKGTVCLLQGRAEFIEKYFEVVRELKIATSPWSRSIGAGRAYRGGCLRTGGRDTWRIFASTIPILRPS